MTEVATTILADRLTLHPLIPEDADEMVDVLADKRLYDFIGGGPQTLDELRARYERLAVGRSVDGLEEWRNWVVRRRSDGRRIGFVQATIVNEGREAAIAWVIGVPWQGQGYATEATNVLVRWLEARGTSSISAKIHQGNIASAAVAARIGLVPTSEIANGERVWRGPQPKRNPETPATTDESR